MIKTIYPFICTSDVREMIMYVAEFVTKTRDRADFKRTAKKLLRAIDATQEGFAKDGIMENIYTNMLAYVQYVGKMATGKVDCKDGFWLPTKQLTMWLGVLLRDSAIRFSLIGGLWRTFDGQMWLVEWHDNHVDGSLFPVTVEPIDEDDPRCNERSRVLPLVMGLNLLSKGVNKCEYTLPKTVC